MCTAIVIISIALVYLIGLLILKAMSDSFVDEMVGDGEDCGDGYVINSDGIMDEIIL